MVDMDLRWRGQHKVKATLLKSQPNPGVALEARERDISYITRICEIFHNLEIHLLITIWKYKISW